MKLTFLEKDFAKLFFINRSLMEKEQASKGKELQGD